jgi:hypothetical protein
MTEHLNAHHVVILAALRDAAFLRREPKTLTPTGHEQWFSLRQLRDEDRLAGLPLGVLDPPARTLRKRGLTTGRTIHGTVLYALTDEGLALLTSLEERAGITGLTAADREVEQARFDIQVAKRREAAALGRVRAVNVRRPTYAEIADLSEEACQ